MVTSITVQPIAGGLLSGVIAAHVGIGGAGASAPALPVPEALGRIATALEDLPDKVIFLQGSEILNPARSTEMNTLMEIAYQKGWQRILNIDNDAELTPNVIPEWLPAQMTSERTMWIRSNITGEPWLRYRCNELIYHLHDPDIDPQVPNAPDKTALYVKKGPNATHRDVLSFLKRSPWKWKVFDPSGSLFQMVVYPLKEDMGESNG